jgi:hypothetical protein
MAQRVHRSAPTVRGECHFRECHLRRGTSHLRLIMSAEELSLPLQRVYWLFEHRFKPQHACRPLQVASLQ